MMRYGKRLVPYLSGVLGSFGIVRALVTLLYQGEPADGRALLLCCALWALLWTRFYGVLYLLSAVAVLLCPILHITVTWQAVCLLFVSFVSARAWDKHRAIPVAGCIAVFCLTAGAALGYGREDAFVEGIFWLEHSANGLYGSDGAREGWFENGSINRGNSYCDGTVELDIVLDRRPTEALYLRGYVGADYQGSRWTEADEDSFYNKFSDSAQDGRNGASIRDTHDNLYFLLNYGSGQEWTQMIQGRSLSQEEARKVVLNRRDAESRRYMPYFSFYAARAERYYRLEEAQEVDTYFYYEFSDMNPDRMNESMAWFPPSVERVRQGYGHYVQEAYLQVPKRRIPRIAALCEEQDLSSADEVTDFIQRTLQADTVYTRTPGNTPVNQDVIEYFLFENKRGYCMHYASAAVLMYRLYGIPARYVSGYVAYPEDFERQADGTYSAALNDYRRHAWVEIYREEFGWVPVEMTPVVHYAAELSEADWLMPQRIRPVSGGEGGAAAGTQAVGDEEEDEEEDEEDDEEDEEEEEDEDEEEDEEDEEDEAKAGEKARGQGGGRRAAALLALGGSAVFAGAGILLWLRRRLRIKRLQKADVRQIFYRLLKLLHMRAGLAGYTGTEADFEEKLLAEFPSFTEAEVAELMRIVREAAYGPERSQKEDERRSVQAFYEKAAAELYGRMRLHQRLYCTWILNIR